MVLISDGDRNVLGANMVVRQSRPNATTASSEVKAFTSSESDKNGHMRHHSLR